MSIEKLNSLEKNILKEEFFKCCGSNNWVKGLLKESPFNSQEELFNKSDKVWNSLNKSDYLEAFAQHPKIGDINSLAKKFANTKGWAENEQSGVNSANQQVIEELAKYNDIYDKRFGYIFIVCATGKSAQEMLDILKSRIDNDSEKELKIAGDEQNKITKIRLEKLLKSL
ncbi:MAG: 2-oxo-4-hydroxy-4-carboxy-5-ureidoimidazoline decarboxylase [Candidatus Sericytochromatia bacterium]